MKKVIWLLVGGFLGSACQYSGKPANAMQNASGAQRLADSTAQELVREQAYKLADSLRREANLRLPPLGSADTLTMADQVLLRLHNLAPLWAAGPGQRAMEGFYGPAHQRISVYLDEVWRDSLRPELFWVRGRNRYRKIITPFTGTLLVRALVPAQLDVDNSYRPADSVTTFVVRATYELREDPTTKGAGVYQGEALLDLYQGQNTQLHQAVIYNSGNNPTAGGGLLFRGTWVDNGTGRRRAAAWANELRAVTPLPVLYEQQAGGRMGDVDPVLAKLGWNEFWENDEWWAASPKPPLL